MAVIDACKKRRTVTCPCVSWIPICQCKLWCDHATGTVSSQLSVWAVMWLCNRYCEFPVVSVSCDVIMQQVPWVPICQCELWRGVQQVPWVPICQCELWRGYATGTVSSHLSVWAVTWLYNRYREFPFVSVSCDVVMQQISWVPICQCELWRGHATGTVSSHLAVWTVMWLCKVPWVPICQCELWCGYATGTMSCTWRARAMASRTSGSWWNSSTRGKRRRPELNCSGRVGSWLSLTASGHVTIYFTNVHAFIWSLCFAVWHTYLLISKNCCFLNLIYIFSDKK